MVPVKEHDVLNELRTLQRLHDAGEHPNIVSVYGHGKLRDNFYFIDMELCSYDLEAHLYNRGLGNEARNWLNMLEICGIMENISSGLTFMHRFYQVHRDLKPRNGTEIH